MPLNLPLRFTQMLCTTVVPAVIRDNFTGDQLCQVRGVTLCSWLTWKEEYFLGNLVREKSCKQQIYCTTQASSFTWIQNAWHAMQWTLTITCFIFRSLADIFSACTHIMFCVLISFQSVSSVPRLCPVQNVFGLANFHYSCLMYSKVACLFIRTFLSRRKTSTNKYP